MKRIERNLTDTSTDIGKELQELTDSLKKACDEIETNYQKHFAQILEMNKSYNDKMRETNPYSVALAEMQKEQEALTVDIGNYKDAREKKLAIDQWYMEERQKLSDNKNNLSDEDQMNALLSLGKLYNKRSLQGNDEVWQERGAEISDIFGDGLEDIIQDFGNFDGNMRKMAQNLYSFISDEAMKAILTQIKGTQMMKSIGGMLSMGVSKGGFLGSAASFIKGVGKGFGIFHSGGIVPVGANAELPGTKEQLALLKGGERILSPSENASYNSNGGSGGSSPVVFNNFNIKAWDSKDVSKYLLENKQLLNSITYEGIKSNNNQLRNMVRNA